MKLACLATVLLASAMFASASPFSFLANGVGDATSCDAEETEALTCLDQNGYVDTMEECFAGCGEGADDDLDCAGLCALTETCLQTCTPLCETQVDAALKCISEQYPDEDFCACEALWLSSTEQPGSSGGQPSGEANGADDATDCAAEGTAMGNCFSDAGYGGTEYECYSDCAGPGEPGSCADLCTATTTCGQTCFPQCSAEFQSYWDCSSLCSCSESGSSGGQQPGSSGGQQSGSNGADDNTGCATEGTAVGNCLRNNGYGDTEHECYSDCAGPEEPESCEGLCAVINTCSPMCFPQCSTEFQSYLNCNLPDVCSCSESESGSGGGQPCAAETDEALSCFGQNGYLDTMEECFEGCGEGADDDLGCLQCDCIQTCIPLCETQAGAWSKCISAQHPDAPNCACAALGAGVSSIESFTWNLAHDLKTKKSLRA